jgi:biotin carboxyl carrier protein
MRYAWRDGERTRVVEISPDGPGGYRLTIDGAPIRLEAAPLEGDHLRLTTESGVALAEVTVQGSRRFVRLGSLDFVIEVAPARSPRGRAAQAGGLESPMPGMVTRVEVAAGDTVTKGQPLVVLEAMKMEHVIRSPADGRVARVNVTAGEMVNGGVAVVELEEPA